jgi:hypothetical protein
MSGHVETLTNLLQEPTSLDYLPPSTISDFPPGSIAVTFDASRDLSPSDRLGNYQSSGTTAHLAPYRTFLDGSVLPLSGDVNPQVGL